MAPGSPRAPAQVRPRKLLGSSLSVRRVVGLGLFLFSYALLFIGLFGSLVHFEHSIELREEWFADAPDKDLFDKAITVLDMIGEGDIPVVPATTKSLLRDHDRWNWSVLHFLMYRAQRGQSSYLAPGILMLFGIVIPAVKFLAVGFWALSPCGARQAALSFAARASRWTAVDAVAEAMVVALLLRGGMFAEHRLGFVAFVGYCLLSAVSIWIIDDASEGRSASAGAHVFLPMFGSGDAWRGTSLLTLVLYLGLFFVGAAILPVAKIDIPKDILEWQLTQELGKFQGVINLLGEYDNEREIIRELLKCVPLPSGVASLVVAAQTLLTSGHPYTVAGSVLLFTCVVVCPVLEAISSRVVALQACDAEERTANQLPKATPRLEQGVLLAGFDDDDDTRLTHAVHSRPLSAAERIQEASSDLAMLDVYVVGMFAGSLILGAIGDVMRCTLLPGYYCLAAAAAAGHLHASVCGAAALGAEQRLARSVAEDASRATAKEEAEFFKRRSHSRSFFTCCGAADGQKIRTLPPPASARATLATASPRQGSGGGAQPGYGSE
eukprot:TRINITY_DN9343_c0_g2_i1.p1 TRINITY_DN9343_c0_g2~~TRINITY_DN9343_c0_g2_i1.p1  ORF type:complete len:585 (+),score=138.81 TRINITY_DN9343_c0_g2_i1:102-1757(+)